ncbi:YraN family protein [Nostoc sp. CENA67]|uniref:UPF0102 protein I8748_06570 n=1 Tax=Amazonocrinis nigriterrae CENA67 TaxID=2794033 RepID=A0A8J7HR15_9NOST|nr:YraN family protein [Amazonocrinis nigriterrae]MBH8561842.1 YraN family protein [Amazonocrinis nigriterrae CENA67]
MANLPPSHYLDIGSLGEDLVAQWLESTGWEILHRRFACRWGEIDIIAQYPGKTEEQGNSGPPQPEGGATALSRSADLKHVALGIRGNKGAGEELPTQDFTLAFVEVKTRKSGNWDAGGRSAITVQKQAKISRTAGIFLAEYPQKADYACRFDVAIVYCQRISKLHTELTVVPDALARASAAGYQFYLQEYILAAFDSAIDS